MTTTNKTQQTEAERLKAIYLQRKKANPALTQEAIAETAGWGTQSVVSQYLNGRIPLNLPALLKFASILDFDPAEVSSRLGLGLRAAPKSYSTEGSSSGVNAQEQDSDYIAQAGPTNQALDMHPIETWSDDTPIGDDEVAIPYYKEVELAAGKGSEVMLETEGRKLRFGKRTLQRKGITPEAAACALVTGNSMEPVLPDGSTVAVDTSATQIVDGKMYAINQEGQLRVKLVYRLPGQGLRLRSYNSDEHPDERYDGQYVAQHIHIIGKVFWYAVLI
jgi:phage repressor protein C with HTH and peptisase S24 domain